MDPKTEGLNVRSLNSQHITSVMYRVMPKIFLKRLRPSSPLALVGISPTASTVLVSSFTRVEFGPRSISLVTFSDINGNGNLEQIELGCKIKRLNIGQIM